MSFASLPEDIVAQERDILDLQNNLSTAYLELGRHEDAVRVQRDLYLGCVRLYGEDHEQTLNIASDYAASLRRQHQAEARSLMRKTMPVARRVLGESKDTTLLMRWNLARALYVDPDATLDNLREAVMTSEESERIALRVLGDSHELTADFGNESRAARAALAAVVQVPGVAPVDALAISDLSGSELATFFESRLSALATEDAEEAAD